jgi:hypothetical protein
VNPIGLLIKSCIEHNPHEVLTMYRVKLEWAANQFQHTVEDFPSTLKALLYYDQKNNHCPDSYLSLRQFVELNPEKNSELIQNTEIIVQELEALEADDSEVSSDCEMLALSVFDWGTQQYDVTTYKNAALIAGCERYYPKGTKDTGPTTAQVYLADRRSKRMDNNRRGLSGDFVENLDEVSRGLDAYQGEGNADKFRIKTGFKNVDDRVLIGPKHQRWIGILGYLNHGKSGFLMSMLYNMARDGANVVFIPREFSVDDSYERFLWMHANIFPEHPMVGLDEWKRGGGTAGVEHWRTKQTMIDHLKNGGLKGSIDVQNIATWEEIEEYIRMRSYKKPVDVLAIDYIGHLEVHPGRGDNDIEARKRVFRKAQMLTQNGIFNDGKGMVVITPLQANKKYYEEAATREGDKYGTYSSAAAVDWYTQAAQDMDLLMSVFSEGEIKEAGQMILHCLKSRGKYFPDHRIEVHKESRYMSDIGLKTTTETSDIVANLGAKEISEMIYTSDAPWEAL